MVHTTTVSDLLDLLDSQEGDKYIFGSSASPSESDPAAFDCSHLIYWGCQRLGISIPDGSWRQYQYCVEHGTVLSIEQAIRTPGALLFYFEGDPMQAERPRNAHVAVSHGDGTTIEARSSKYGVGTFRAHGRRWSHAATIPSLTSDVTGPIARRDVDIHVQLSKVSRHGRKRGKDVRTVQSLLHARGFGEIVGEIDGVFGKQTDKALRRFQRRAQVADTGVTDADTWSALLTW
jgi:cell wall-associated NlpC family hydrolase